MGLDEVIDAACVRRKHGAVGGLVSLILSRIALGCGEGSALPTATQAMTRWTAASRWGFAQGITHSFARLGNFITPQVFEEEPLWRPQPRQKQVLDFFRK